MHTRSFTTLLTAGLALSFLPTAAWADKADKAAKKEAKQDVKAVVAEKDGPEVSPELRTPRLDARLEKLRLLIVQGAKDGQLTRGELASVEIKYKRIEREEDHYKQNDKVTAREKKDLRRDLNDLHEYLWTKTHNGQKPTEPLEK